MGMAFFGSQGTCSETILECPYSDSIVVKISKSCTVWSIIFGKGIWKEIGFGRSDFLGEDANELSWIISHRQSFSKKYVAYLLHLIQSTAVTGQSHIIHKHSILEMVLVLLLIHYDSNWGVFQKSHWVFNHFEPQKISKSVVPFWVTHLFHHLPGLS
jgi:hypothetical protein